LEVIAHLFIEVMSSLSLANGSYPHYECHRCQFGDVIDVIDDKS